MFCYHGIYFVLLPIKIDKHEKASVLFLAMAAVTITACSSDTEETEETTVEKVEYTLDASASTLKWHGEENENHYHDGVIAITERLHDYGR